MSDDPTTLLTVDAEVGGAIVTVLRRHGCPAWSQPSASVAEVDVLVPGGRRGEGLSMLAQRMEEIREITAAVGADGRGEPGADAAGLEPEDASEDHARPLLMPQLRRFGIVVLLVPLLAVTLAASPLPRDYALGMIVLGMVAVVALRNRIG